MRIRSLMLSAALVFAGGAAFAKPMPFENTLTGLIPDLYAGLDVVSRELVGFVPTVSRDSGAERAAVNQQVRYHIAPPAVATDIVPSMTIPEPTDQTIGYGFMTISKSRTVPFGFVGEAQRGLNNGPGYVSVQANMFAQALRALVNEVENDIAVAAVAAASRATGTAATTPFATNLGDSAQARKILDDNGAPPSDRALVINTSTGANLRTLGQLTKANEAGDTMTLHQGALMNLHNFTIAESGQLGLLHVKGTGASATTSTAGFAIGATTIALAAAGTGTILAGDVITFAGDTNKYVVVTGDADTSNGGSIVIAAPGLRQAIPGSATAITVGGTYSANVGFSASAIHLVTRAPAMPEEGDAATDKQMITDPRSGLTFEVCIYKGFKKVRYDVGLAWGVKAVKSEHISLLLG